jgi:2-polyprenyl-6-methoxyphenol hydroxylase-like FAD-dependent oxidoreductase
MPGPYRIGVVGFGVAGATVAYLLAKAGHEVTLIERAPKMGPVGAGVLLQPSGQWVLERIGLLDRVIARSEPIDELHAVTNRGRTMVRLSFEDLVPPGRAYGVHRGDLFEVLRQAAIGSGVRIVLGHEIQARRIEGSDIFALDTHGGLHGPYHFLIAADGSRSRLRTDVAMTRWEHDYTHGALWAIGHCTAVQRKLHQVVRGTHELLGLLPMGDGRCSLFWGLKCAQKDPLLQRGFDAWRTQVLALCPLAEEVFATVTGFEHVTFTTYKHVWMKRWHDDRIVFLGDAAHSMSPHLGQGLNLALLDAYHFAAALDGSQDFHAASCRYSAKRIGHVRFYGNLTLLLSPFFQSDGLIKGLGRNVALPLMTRVPWLRRRMVGAMAGIRRGILGGSIT